MIVPLICVGSLVIFVVICDSAFYLANVAALQVQIFLFQSLIISNFEWDNLPQGGIDDGEDKQTSVHQICFIADFTR